MHLASRVFFSLVLIFFPLFNHGWLLSEVLYIPHQPLTLKECLLPKDHPLQKPLKHLFEDEHLFDSPDHLRKTGFPVLDRVHRGLMVIRHPSIKNYLFKKFQNSVSQKNQLDNFLRRINGARALRDFIKLNHLQHIVVPEKWLYPLPKRYAQPKINERAYILLEDEIDICSGGADLQGEVAQKYYHIDFEILRELCLVAYYFRGLDSVLHNVPFTYQNKIAFIDTERWERKREGFLLHIMPYLSEDRQEYVLMVLQELQTSNP